MMMPRAGDIPVTFDTESTDGFRIGLMADFGLDMSDAEDITLDDIIYIDTTPNGGIIAGSNPGAMLIAVYRYLKKCGCRWLFPGIDGEWIPNVDALPAVKYRKMADHRYRGQCNEGAEFQANMMEVINFEPKIGLNSFMMEGDIPYGCYDSYFSRSGNSFRKKEKIQPSTVLQWRRQCEMEVQKRGLHLHGMGHGWTTDPFGLYFALDNTPEYIAPDVKNRFALVNGKRDVYGILANTNFCMSNAENRDIVAKYVADHAQVQNNLEYLHVWLSDGTNNDCECENCRDKRAADWYVILLNDIDAELERRGLNTHIVFIMYHATMWKPVEEKIKNTKRFTLLYAPITRKYTETYGETPDLSAVRPYVLNKNVFPKGMAECLGYLQDWKEVWPGDCFCYEYHFWRHQGYDPSGMYLAELLHHDVAALRKNGLHGMIEDGSQRSYFPTGLAYYVYGETLFDASSDFDELREDYLSHAFGENWRLAEEFLNKIRKHIDFAYLSGLMSADEEKGLYYNPEVSELAKQVPMIVREFAPVIEANLDQPYRAASVSWQMLEYLSIYVDMLSKAIAYKAVGDDENAKTAAKECFDKMSELEVYIEHWYDQHMIYYALKRVFGLE